MNNPGLIEVHDPHRVVNYNNPGLKAVGCKPGQIKHYKNRPCRGRLTSPNTVK